MWLPPFAFLNEQKAKEGVCVQCAKHSTTWHGSKAKDHNKVYCALCWVRFGATRKQSEEDVEKTVDMKVEEDAEKKIAMKAEKDAETEVIVRHPLAAKHNFPQTYSHTHIISSKHHSKLDEHVNCYPNHFSKKSPRKHVTN
jgi:hypothetical protein